MSLFKLGSIAFVIAGLTACSTPPQNPNATGANGSQMSDIDTAPGLNGSELGNGDAQVQIGGVNQDGIASMEIGSGGMDSDQLSLDAKDGFEPVIYFGYDQFDLTPEGLEKVQFFSDILVQNPNKRVILEGHTDERGSPEYNLALGERRAKAVQDAMTALGIEASRIEANSYGEEYPVAFEKTEEAWQLNRRVEITIR
ncbi:OmpA family protein [Thiomicrorhabdus indica]|uniref:OmpA family protein n=1 Tax=Thiomicrorhabdus indica TaxID=2267253 RepID=UPI0013EEB86B|nr:OmpA family protein [Thiomicrorhabdus indica]